MKIYIPIHVWFEYNWWYITYGCRFIGVILFEFLKTIEKFWKPNHQCVIAKMKINWLCKRVQIPNSSWNTNLVVKPNWMAHVKTVFRKCGGLHNSFVCCHISDINIFTSFGFRILSVRTDLLVRRDIVLILSRSFKLLI